MKDPEVPYGYIKGNDLYLSAWGDLKDRKIGEIKEDGPEAAVAYFQGKFEDLKKKISDLSATIDAAQNKGSYLMKLLHLKDLLNTHEGLGDYQELKDAIAKNEEVLGEIIQKNRERNSEIKKALLEEIKAAVEIINWTESTEKVQDVKVRWLKTGNAREEEHEQLEEDFWKVITDFFERKKSFYEDKRKLNDARKAKYEEILARTNDLSGLKGKDRFDRVKELKAAWGEVGNIPARDYKELSARFNERLKGRKEIPAPDFGAMAKELSRMFDRETEINKPLLQQYRKSLGSFKTRDPELKEKRHETMQRINLIWERDFLENLAGKKYKGFRHKSEDEKAGLMVKLLVEFIRRDKMDLRQYEENSEKFAGHDVRTNRMLQRKLGQQKNKITVKERLLDILTQKDNLD